MKALGNRGDTSLTGLRIVNVVPHLATTESITVDSDSGPEFISKALDEWGCPVGVHLDFIDPGKPLQNAYIENSR